MMPPSLIVISVLSVLIQSVCAFPDQSRWSFNAENEKCHYFTTHSALYANSTISVQLACTAENKNASIDVGLVIRASPCYEEYIGFEIALPDFLKWYYHCPTTMHGDFGYEKVSFLKTPELTFKCNDIISLNAFGSNFKSQPIDGHCKPDDGFCHSSSGDFNQLSKYVALPRKNVKNGHSITLPSDDVYLFVLKIRSQSEVNITVNVNFISPTGHFLSAIDQPLLHFYALMSGVYLLYALIWFVVSMLQWKELLRIQFCIAVVIFLGMLEKAIFYGVYETLDNHGHPNHFAFYIAEIFSCLKRTFARVLVIIVSCGFEIVKPHLGTTLNKIIAIGVLYFILGSLEATMRIYKPKSDPSNQTLFAGVPLALLDTSICWWIFSNLVNTMKILRIRRNIVKLKLFNMFTNVLVFSLLASIGFMIWQIRTHKFSSCISNWKNLWYDEAYWHVLFSIILLAIMILWRPTRNNQRYAFTPLLDVSDDDEGGEHDAFDDNIRLVETMVGNDVKNRSFARRGSPEAEDAAGFSKETVDNLKWIEENISSSLLDIDNDHDSDEELLNTRFEINKMQ